MCLYIIRKNPKKVALFRISPFISNSCKLHPGVVALVALKNIDFLNKKTGTKKQEDT